MYILDEGAIEEGDKETLLLTVEALKAQLEEQTRLCKEQVSLELRGLVKRAKRGVAPSFNYWVPSFRPFY